MARARLEKNFKARARLEKIFKARARLGHKFLKNLGSSSTSLSSVKLWTILKRNKKLLLITLIETSRKQKLIFEISLISKIKSKKIPLLLWVNLQNKPNFYVGLVCSEQKNCKNLRTERLNPNPKKRQYIEVIFPLWA